MNDNSSQKRISEHSGEQCSQSKKVKEDNPEQPISSSNSSSYHAGPLLSAKTNNVSSSSDWDVFGEQSTSNSRRIQKSTSISSSTLSSLSNSIGLLLSGAAGSLSQLFSSETSKNRPMTRDEEKADLEASGWKRNQYSLEKFLTELYKRNNVRELSFKEPDFDTFERFLQPSCIDMLKVDRDDIVENFWANANTFTNRKEIFFIHGSPGCGKTHALREIGRVSRTKEKSNYVCVGISFTSVTSVTNYEFGLAEKNPLFAGQILSIPRIIYSLFVKDISYDIFSASFFQAFDIIYMMSMVTSQSMSLLKSRRTSEFEIILLVDAIEKIRSPDFIESALSYMCRLIREPNYAYCIFSTLNFKIIVDTGKFETSSGRRVVPLGPLHMFNLRDRIHLFNVYFEMYGFRIIDRNGIGYSEENYKKVLSLLIHNMAIYAAGHPRSLDAIMSTLSHLLKNSKREPVRLSKVMESACILINGSLKPDFIAVCESLIARTVNYHDKIPFSDPEITYDEAFAEGLLIGSIKNECCVPFLTPMAYYNFICDNLFSNNAFHSLMARHLNNILNLQSFFTYEGFEHIAYTREALMSITRNYSQNSPETFRQLLHSLGLYSTKCDLFNVSLMSSTCFHITKFTSATDYLSSSQSNIYVPENKRNEGFDFFIRFPTNDNGFLNIVFEMKYSDPTSTSPANLNKAMIDKKHDQCKRIFGDEFIFVVFGWRELYSTLQASELPSNTVVFDKNALSQLYGPSFADLINIQLTDEPQLILGASIEQVVDVNSSASL